MNELSLSFEDFPYFINSLSSNFSLLLVSHKDNDDVQRSMAINLDDLAQQLKYDIIHPRSAAYHESSYFALSNHDHDIYTSAIYTSSLTTIKSITALSINVLSSEMNGNEISYGIISTYNMKLSAIESNLTPEEKNEIESTLSGERPKLGELRFIAASNLKLYYDMINPTLSSFMGWVPADGKTYSKSDFILSNNIPHVFKNNESNNFQVPSLMSFCKINDELSDNNSYNINAGLNALKIHTHSAQIPDDNRFNVNANTSQMLSTHYEVPTSSGTADQTAKVQQVLNRKGGFRVVHHGKNFKSNLNMTFTKNLDNNSIEGSLMRINEDGTDVISEPSHNTIPVLVYVGYSKYSKPDAWEITITH